MFNITPVRVIILYIIFWGLVIAMLLCGGCGSNPHGDAKTLIGRTQANAVGIRSDLDGAKQFTSSQGRPYLDAADYKAEEIIKDTDVAEKAITWDRQKENKQAAKLNKLNGSTFVWIEKVLKVSVLVVGGLMLIGWIVVPLLGNTPLSRFLVAFLPAMNPVAKNTRK